MLALVLTGMPSEHPISLPTLDWLEANPADGTYAIAVRDALVAASTSISRARGSRADAAPRPVLSVPTGWDYRDPPRPHMLDHSLTQFAFQALADAASVLEPVPDGILQLVRGGFVHTQNPDGGWTYRIADAGRGRSRGSMTAAGLATLALAERMAPAGGVLAERTRRAMDAAVRWLDTNFSADSHPGHAEHLYYWMHAVERASRTTGAGRYGGRGWFDGFLGDPRAVDRLRRIDRLAGAARRSSENLAFAIMVLRRGLEPLVFAGFDPDGLDAIPSPLGRVASRSAVVSSDASVGPGWIFDPVETWARFRSSSSDGSMPRGSRRMTRPNSSGSATTSRRAVSW